MFGRIDAVSRLFNHINRLSSLSLRFCNKRQALKNSAKKFKTSQINDDNDSTRSSLIDTQSIDTTTNQSKAE